MAGRGFAYLDALGAAVVVFLALAFHQRTTRSRFEAKVSVAVVPGSTGSARPNPERLLEVLRPAVFDAALGQRLAKAAGVPETPLGVAGVLADAIGFRVAGDSRLEVTCVDTDRDRAGRLCAEVARSLVERAPGLWHAEQERRARAQLGDGAALLAEFAATVVASAASAASPAPSAVTAKWTELLHEVRSGAAVPTPTDTEAPQLRALNLSVSAPSPGGGMMLGIIVSLAVGLVSGLARPRRRAPLADSLAAAAPPMNQPELTTAGSSDGPSAATGEAPPQTSTTMLPPPEPLQPSHDALRASLTEPADLGQIRPSPIPRVEPEPAPHDTAREPEPRSLLISATDLNPQSPPPSIPVRRTTQIMGSPVPPRIESTSSIPPSGGRTTRQGSSASRYSFVSTPPPPGGAPVKPYDAPPDWTPDPRLDPASCHGLSRELFAFGVEQCFALGVTCVAGLEEEKSVFTASLALALTSGGHARVLLIDANFDDPAQHRLLRVEMPPNEGFSHQLRLHMMGQPADHWGVLRCNKSLHVLAHSAEQGPGLILSRSFESCVRSLRAYYDFILLDGPSGSREAECRALDGVIDGLVVTCTEELKNSVPRTSRFFTAKRFSKAIRVTSPAKR